MTTLSNLKPMIPAIFKQMLSFSKFSCVPPIFERIETRPIKLQVRNHTNASNHSTIEWVSMNYIPFGEKALSVAVKLYQQTAAEETVIEGQILHEIIKAVRLPLSLKYKCMSASTWKLAITSLMSVLHTGFPVVRLHPSAFVNMWPDLSETLDKFLFPSR